MPSMKSSDVRLARDSRARDRHGRDSLRHARECYERRAWADAHEAFRVADRAMPLDVDDLFRVATTAYLIGRDAEFEQWLDRLHRLQLDANDLTGAARSAFWLSVGLLVRGETAQGNAWIMRGQRLIESCDCVERGYLLLPVAEIQVREGKGDDAYATARAAGKIGDSYKDVDLIASARQLEGRALIQQGKIVAGLSLLDETMLAVVAGQLMPIMTGLTYCSVITACCRVHALSRAREWTFALSRWCEQLPETAAFSGTCLVHRGEIMQFHGEWPDALAEARRACAHSERANRRPPAAALYLQADIHRLRGDWAQAEQAYRTASQLGCDPQPGLALLRAARGRTDAASAAMRRVLCTTIDPPQRVRLLPAAVEILLAAGDLEESRSVCRELAAAAETFDSDVLRACAAQGLGAVELAADDARAALNPLRRAFETWSRLDAPYEGARVRVLLALACRELGDEDTAGLEIAAAKAVFERLGAQPDLARLDRLKSRATSRDGDPLTTREHDVLRLIAAGHTNKEIAAQFRVSERTVDRHVSNILGKLDVPSRAAATAYAYGHRLL
jgi:DNA-binding CsgD family transcriptional regulator